MNTTVKIHHHHSAQLHDPGYKNSGVTKEGIGPGTA